MDHNELARRMGVTCTGSSSHSDKSRMHLKEGGPAVTKISSSMGSPRKYGENGAGRLKPSAVHLKEGGFTKSLEQVYKRLDESNKKRVAMGEHPLVGSSMKMSRQEASVGGDIVNMGKSITKRGVDFAGFAGRKIKSGAEKGAEYAGRQLKSGAEAGFKRAKVGAEDVARKAKSGLEDFASKAKESLNLSHGGDAGRKKANIGGNIQNAAMEAKNGAEDFGRKAKAGFEDFGRKAKKAFHLAEGGEASMSSEMPMGRTRKVTKTIKKGEMPYKETKQVARGSLIGKPLKSILKE